VQAGRSGGRFTRRSPQRNGGLRRSFYLPLVGQV